MKRWMTVAALAAATILSTAALAAVPSAAQAVGTNYYVNCSASVNGTGTLASPWNSLASVNGHAAFVAGDVIFFSQGTTCNGTLAPLGSGTSTAPITLDSYAGATWFTRPIINGGTGEEALKFSNQQYWTVQNLEITGGNYRNIWVTGTTANTTFHGFTFQNLSVHDTAEYNTAGTWYTDAGGIILDPCNSTTKLADIEINNVAVHHTFAQGIQVGHESDVPQLSTCTTANYANSVSNVTIENVVGDENGATAIAVYWSSNVTVQNSKLFNNGANGVHGEGSWSYHCDGCIWQHNESFGNRLGDGGGFDMDGETTNSVVQYNYIHDNEGYCVSAFAVGGTGNINNSGNTIRYNVCSHNDTGAAIPSFGYDSGEIFVSNFVNSGAGISGNQVSGLSVYNNTIYAAPAGAGVPAISLQTSANVPLFASGSTNVAKNNIVYSDEAVIVGTDNAGMAFDYNRYYFTGGSPQFAYNSSTNHTVNYTTFASYQSGSGQDAHSVIANPGVNLPTYHSNNISPTAGTLASGSNALGTGVLIASNGGKDAFFNNVSATAAPNIGAYNGSATAGAPAFTGTHVITNRYSALPMGVNGATTNGTLVAQYTANGANDQKWTITAVGDYYKIINVLSGLALDDYAYQTQNIAPVNQWTDNGGANQLWSIVPVGGGYYRIINQYSGLVLDDEALGTVSGSRVIQFTYHAANNQVWAFS